MSEVDQVLVPNHRAVQEPSVPKEGRTAIGPEVHFPVRESSCLEGFRKLRLLAAFIERGRIDAVRKIGAFRATPMLGWIIPTVIPSHWEAVEPICRSEISLP